MALARMLKWAQAKVSRVEQGKRSVTLSELMELGRVFRCSVSELLGELESQPVAHEKAPGTAQPSLTPGFYSAFESEVSLLPQLARYGVRFLGGAEHPALSALPVDEVLLAALRFSRDPRLFETLPALLLRNAARVDWTKLAAAAYALRLQNRLGMVVAAALALKDFAKDVDEKAWKRLDAVHEALAEAKLDKEEVVGPVPKTEAAWDFLRRRTPPWLSFWHGVGSADLDSFRRHLPR